MDLDQLRRDVWERIVPQGGTGPGWWALLALGAALAAVIVPVIWLRARLAVTIVHELGHAVVGMAVGRRFTGFVVSPDMSGHAVSVGPRRGAGRVLSTWAGYPAPAVVGALLVQLAFGGWAGAVLFAALAVLVVSMLFARSVHTVLVILVTAAVVGGVWWWGGAVAASGLVLGGGVLLLLGAWRHLGAVVASGGRRDDPAQLAELTGVPAWAWSASHALVAAACTWWAWTALAPHVL